MSGSGRQEGHKSQTHYGAVSAAMAPGQWPLSVHYSGDVGMPVGLGAAFECNFGRPEEYNHPLISRVNAAKVLLLIDNVRLTRECLSHLLSTQLGDYEVVSVAHAQQVAETNAVRPDVVLLNVGAARLADGPLLNDIATIFTATRRAPMLLLSEHGEPSEESQAAEFGMVGLFPSTFGVSLLIAAIHLVVAGGQFHIPVTSARQFQSRLEVNGARR
jgi:CheY-like chemotaxis protein